jgi:hypothetical protein
MKKTVFFFLVTLLFVSTNNSPAQSFYYEEAPKSQTQVIWGLHVGWMPLNHWALPLSMESPDGKVDIHRRKHHLSPFATSDFYLGVKGIVRNPQSRLGGFYFIDYRNRGFDMKYPGDNDYKTHIAQSVSPAAGLRLSIGNMMNPLNWVLEAGVAYNYNFKYSGSYNNDLKVVNNGFSGIYGFGFEYSSGRRNTVNNNELYRSLDAMPQRNTYVSNPFYCTMTLQYRQDYYDFFNNNFSTGGIQPYKGFHSNFGYIAITLTFKFSQ